MADNQQYGPLAPKQTSASDIRKVIANGPKAIGQGSTIATSDELKKKEVDKANSNPKVPTTTKKQTTTTKTNTNVVAPKQTNTVSKKPETQGVNKFASLMQGQISGDLFKNPAVQPINDIKVVKQDNEATHNAAPNNNNDISFMNNFGRAKELKAAVDIDNALMDLYSDIKVKVDNGTLASSDVSKMKQAYPEFANMGDDVLLSMIGDMASIANKKMPFNDVNMKKLKSLYPELNSAAWGFDKGSSENMYQAGGMREQMAQSSKTDLNRFGTAGAVAEGVINPLGEATTILDMGAQMIPQVDGSGNENRLKKALSKLTDEDINKYYEQYQNYVKNHGTLSKLYTTQLEGDTVVEQLWNWATGKGKKDVDAGFRDWLIDRVNNEVNGWAGEVTGAANELKGVGGPNVAKMYANMPSSTVKTVTAITRAITNPVDTAAGLYHLFGTEEGRQALISRYGSWDGFAKALEQDPVGVASDGLAVVEGGAGLTKMATGGLSKASLLAGLSTEALGAARTTENLLKLATRLENMAVKAGKIEKTAGLASNLGADLPINKVINGLRKWGESGESMIQKAAKYSANASQNGIGTIAGKAIDEGKKIIKEGPINTIANKLMGSASDTDKLFKAASPNLNKLTNNVNYKNKRQNMDIATQAIVDAGYTPKSLSEWAKAHTETLNKKWNEFKQMIKDKSDFEVDVKELLTEVKDYIKREREGATEAQKADLRKLEVEVNNIERRGKVDMGFIENRKEHYNSSWRDADKLKVGDIYLKGIKLIGNAMRKQQDNILGKGPEQTKKLRKEIAALMDTKEDVIKADVRNQKKKSDIAGGGLIESYGRLSGLGDFIGGTLSTLTKGGEGLAQAGKGIGKMILGNAMGRARDVDYLTKKGFEGLSNKKKAQNNVGGLKNKFQESKELGELYVERDNLRKELKKDNISNSKKEAINKRLDDVEYAIAQKKARAGLGDKERTLNAENKKKVIDMVTKRAKDVGFTTKVLDGMEKDTQGYTDLRKKLIALEKNPGDTTAQHELFHAFFSVVDNKTKTYILDEAKKILRESGMKDVNAEEWLAESFGIYAKRKQIKLGLIDTPKGFVAKVRDFFQRVYEFMQRFNGDRATINKVFDEVLGNRQMKNGIIDLSDLLGDKEVKVRELGDNGLRNKAVYHGSPADFDRFDSSHMGEGEGAQAHGWGHYVAVEERTGRHYAEMKGGDVKYKGESMRDTPEGSGEKYIAHLIGNRLSNGKSFEYAKKYLTDLWNERMEYYKRMDADHDGTEDFYKKQIEKTQENLDILNKIKEEDFSDIGGRNLYNIDIPDPKKANTPTGSNYLEEGDFIATEIADEFTKKVLESGLEVHDGSNPYGVKKLMDSYKGGPENKVSVKNLYHVLQTVLGSDKKASKFLESLGYDGIHYFGGRDGEAYVIFNDDALQIKDHLRYKKKIGDKEVEINKDITSPEQMSKVNSKGLSVIHDFISEKQAEKALNVSKDILDENGNAYLWTHTNKYDAPQFANFENAKDSKYKEFADREIAWFSNSEEMSRSYADSESKLADTKPIKSIEEFNKRFAEYDVDGSKYNKEWREYKYGEGTLAKTDYKVSIDKVGDGYELNQHSKEYHKYKDLDSMRNGWHLDYDGPDEKEMLKAVERKIREDFINDEDFKLYDDVKAYKGKDGYILELTAKKNMGKYKTAEEALANGTAKQHVQGKYHYQGIIQNMKNPLVIDLGKYGNGEIRYGKDVSGKGRYWNDLGSAYDFLKKNEPEQFKKLGDALEGLKEKRKEYDKKVSELDSKLKEQYNEKHGKYNEAWEEYKNIKDSGGDTNKILEKFYDVQRVAQYWDMFQSIVKEAVTHKLGTSFSSEQSLKFILEDYPEWRKYYDEAVKIQESGLIKESQLNEYLEDKIGINKAMMSMLHGISPRNLMSDLGGIEFLKSKELQTNDIVFYALNKGGYDGVLFKDIVDYGGKGINHKGGDVVAAFNSKQFKAWDNANPTDSKYISYKKKVSLDKKPEGLSKKDSNGLLAKGRERTLGNNGMRYKKDIPEDKKLIGLHNLGIDKLRGVIELGGMPMPSIAVTKKGVPHESYGDITFIMKESAVNPALSRKNKLYTVDGYTPTVPQPTIKVKDTKEANLLMDKIQKETGIGYGELMQWLEYHDDRYFKDYPKLKEFDKYYDQLTEKKLFDGFTYTGKRRYKDYNLDNIVKSMVGNKRDAFNGAFWKMVAQSQGNTTVDKLRERKYGLKDKDLAEKMGEKYYDALRELASKKGIEQKIESLSDYGRFAENVSDAYRANTDAWWRELTQWDGAEGTIYSKITKEDLEPLQKIIKEAAELPRPYSEAKPERAIRFDEVGAVVAPEGKLKEVKDMLKDTGLKVYGYKEGERMSVVDKVADDNGLRFKKAYHGTSSKFDKFDSSHMGEGEGNQAHGWGHYVTAEQDTAKRYAGLKEKVSGGNKFHIDGKPYKEVYDSLSDFEKEAFDSFKALRNEEFGYDFEEAWDKVKKDKTEEINVGIRDMKSSIEYGKKYIQNEKLTPEQKARVESLLEHDKERLKKYEAQKKELYKIDELKARTDAGQFMYELDIPDEIKKDTPTGENYIYEDGLIEWDAMDKFVDEVKKEIGEGSKEEKNKKILDYWSDNKVKGYQLYQGLTEMLGSDKKASKFLEKLGYDGISYMGGLDGESYVLFGDNSPKIKNTIRYKKGLTAKDQTQTPEFKKWFEGSKVVKENGNPQVVYHGTDADFTIFNKIGSRGIYGDGYYFTDKIGTAKNYGADGGKVMKVYLDIKNPYEASTKDQYMLNINKLKEQGYDGVKAKLGNETYWVAFDSNQIKSATDNIGTFDKNNPDIRYKKGYHGSKADFDRFDSSHMGEGEGNQAHGYGHYIAATKKTAKGYAQMGGNPRLSFKGLNRDELADRLIDAKLDGKEFPDGIANAIITRIEDDGLTFKEAKKEAINTFNNIAEEYKANGEMDKFNKTKEEIKTLEGLQRKEFEMEKGRNLYTVDIPDSKKANTPSGENYLNEEKVYGKKVYEKIFEEARKNKGWVNNKGAERYIDDRLKFRGKDQMYGVWINKALEAGFGNDQKAVAKFLEGLGYDGIEYRGLQDGKAYVIFKDDDIEIKNHIRYKKGLEKKKTSSIGRHLEDIDRIASKLGVKGDNAIQKIKKMNKVIKDPKYQGTKIKKELYDLKWEIKKDYIINNNKKIKDRGFRKTTVKIWNGGESAEWHFTKKQYDELKKLGYIVK